MTLYGKEAMEVLEKNAHNYLELEEGKQQKYNHTDCTAGEDTRNRLYVKNVDGAYMWHCHNCNESGYYRPRETVQRIRANSLDISSVKSATIDDATFTEISDTGKLWLANYEFGDKECEEVGIKGVDSGVFLPVYHNKKKVGYQVRRYTGKPKYVTYTNQHWSFFDYVEEDNELLIIVEDLLSSYKLNLTGYSALSLLGTKLPLGKDFYSIVGRFKRILVWLDDDEAGHSAGIKIHRHLKGVTRNITTMYIQQPKELSFDQLSTMEL